MTDVPAIMLEELYGEDFQHELLDKLLRIARSYLELAVEDGASVADRARSMAAALQLIDLAGDEILDRTRAPLKEPWDVGVFEGYRAAAMVMRSVDAPGWQQDTVLGEFELSLHDPDGNEISGGNYTRLAVRFVPTGPDGKEWTNEYEISWSGLPHCVVKRVDTWWRGRSLHAFDIEPTEVLPDERVTLDAGYLILRA